MNVYYSTLTCACKKLINKTFITKLLYPNKKKKGQSEKQILLSELYTSPPPPFKYLTDRVGLYFELNARSVCFNNDVF